MGIPVKCETKSKRNEINRNEIHRKETKFTLFRFDFVSFRFDEFHFVSHFTGTLLHIYKSNLGPSNSDGSNTMDGSNLFESLANFPYIFKLKKIFRSNTDTSNSRT